jgi:hypothetical protein
MPSYIPKKTIHAVLARVEQQYGRLQCELCGRQQHLQMAHIEAKGMGGRHNAAAQRIGHAENILYLCEMCHFRLFHHQIISRGRDSCTTCWLRATCVPIAIARGWIRSDARTEVPDAI